jgi:hypothetical protein
MPNQFGAEERSYRRGLILGLTMAEIMILILFALLLIWMAGLREREKTQIQLVSAAEDNRRLKEELQRIAGSPDAANRFDDLFRELQLAKVEAKELESKIASLEESSRILNEIAAQDSSSSKDPSKALARIRQELQIAHRVLSQLKKSQTTNTAVSDDEIRTAVESVTKAQQSLEKQGIDPSNAGRMISEATTAAQEASTRLKTLEGRLQNAQQRLSALGRGTEMPACWADPTTGKPEYIFDISLQSSTIRIHDNALPNRAQEQAKLPLQSITFETDLKLNDFRTRTTGLFVWSEKEGCRFFVRVFDHTAAHEKAQYKVVLRTVQEHFYTYEDLNGS